MSGSLIYSILLHICTAVILYFGIPGMYTELDPVNIITVSTVQKAEITNLKNQKITTTKNRKNVESKTAKSKLIDTSSKSTSKQVNDPNKGKEHITKQNTAKEEVTSQKLDKNVKNKQDTNKKLSSELENLLKNLENNKIEDEKKILKNYASQSKNESTTNKTYNNTMPLTISEKDNIKIQIEKRFINPVILDFKPQEVVIKLRLEMNPEGELKKVYALNDTSGASARHANAFLSLKENLVRAAHMASPLQNLPKDKYHGKGGWQEIELIFDAYYLMNH